MLTPTPQQQEQITSFFSLMREDLHAIILHPVIDDKTNTERLAICIADENAVYMLGLWFLPGDPLFKRFSFKEPPTRIIVTSPNRFLKCLKMIIRKVCLLWV